MNGNLIHQKEDLFDRIEKYYKENSSLTEQELQICQRWELAFTLLQKHRSKSVAVNKYLKLMEFQKTPLSKNTAYSDFKKAEAIFLPINKMSKDLHRMVIIESIEKDIERLKILQRKLDTNQHKLHLDYQDQINKLYDLSIKAGGLNQDDPNVPDFSRLQMPDIQVNISPKLDSLLKNFAKNGVIDTTEIMRKLTEDADEIDFDSDEETN